MAKKGKAKISKVKRNNQTTNKMRKQGKLNVQRHKTKVQKQKAPEKPQIEHSSESEASADEWADMLDNEEQQYIMKRLAKQPQLLSNIPEEEKPNKRAKKRRHEANACVSKPTPVMCENGAESDSSNEIEDKYELEMAARPTKRLRPLLPIKTKQGLQERAEECEDPESDSESAGPPERESAKDRSESESDIEGTGEQEMPEEPREGGEITTVHLMAARRDRLAHDKLRIGALCSSLLESPQKKLKNLHPVLCLMEERLEDGSWNLPSVRKLATLSICEVFCDILPEYSIKQQDYASVKLKKDTLASHKYERELLEFYKRYLRKLEKAAAVLRKRRGDAGSRRSAPARLALASLCCLGALLRARPHFNFAPNVARSIVPLLGADSEEAAACVADCCAHVFREDRQGRITLTVVRLIGQLAKRLGARLPARAISCLLSLRLRNLDLAEESGRRVKMARDHKKRIVNLSKKEKKRAKKLKEVERELLETQAVQSAELQCRQMTETTKAAFQVYFNLLKSSPRPELLAAALEGVAKFSHVINLEYYSDLVAVLGRLLTEERVRARERLLVARTALATLAGAGDALDVDPGRFHAYLYARALDAHAGASLEDARVAVEAVWQVCGRAGRVSPAVLRAFAKRLATLAAQLPPAEALACLAVLRRLAQRSEAVAGMLGAWSGAGAGRFDPTLPSPEHCNAHATPLAELAPLASHFHPAVRAAAKALPERRPPPFGDLNPVEIFEAYDGSRMAFKPAVPRPKRELSTKRKPHTHTWTQPSFKEYCDSVESSLPLVISDS